MFGSMFIFLAFIRAKITKKKIEDITFYWTFIIILSVIIIPLIILFASLINKEFFYTETQVLDYKNQQPITSVVDGVEQSSEINGTFILGLGGIGGSSNAKNFYYTMVGNNTSGYLLAKYDATTTYIFMDEDNNPYSRDKIVKTIRTPKSNLLFGGLLKKLKPIKYGDDLTYKELHVPKDTIKIQYNIDMN